MSGRPEEQSAARAPKRPAGRIAGERVGGRVLPGETYVEARAPARLEPRACAREQGEEPREMFGRDREVQAAGAVVATREQGGFVELFLERRSHLGAVAVKSQQGLGQLRGSEAFRNMGFKLKEDAEAYSFKNFVKEMYFDSETNMLVISGVPGKENTRNAKGEVLEGAARTPGSSVGR